MAIQALRNRDKMKDYAIAQLSDQLMLYLQGCKNLRESSNHMCHEHTHMAGKDIRPSHGFNS